MYWLRYQFWQKKSLLKDISFSLVGTSSPPKLSCLATGSQNEKQNNTNRKNIIYFLGSNIKQVEKLSKEFCYQKNVFGAHFKPYNLLILKSDQKLCQKFVQTFNTENWKKHFFQMFNTKKWSKCLFNFLTLKSNQKCF